MLLVVDNAQVECIEIIDYKGLWKEHLDDKCKAGPNQIIERLLQFLKMLGRCISLETLYFKVLP